MTARTHDLAALTALGLVVLAEPVQTLTLSTIIVALLANQIGGILPDIDQPTAPFWRNLPVGHFVGKIVDKAMGGHRFLSHSLVGLALFAFLGKLSLRILQPIMPHVNIQVVWWALIIGIVSHLLMDTLTKEGVPWLLPIPVRFGLPPVRRLRITTGKHVEMLVVLPILVILDVWLLTSHYNQLLAFLHHGLIH
jgi:inner membrane protein